LQLNLIKVKLKRVFEEEPANSKWVKLKIDYNLWNKPITKEILPTTKNFKRFYAGLPGLNYKATETQFKELEDLVIHQDVVNEPMEEYTIRKGVKTPLNLILHGPPGTGKTYHTINYALSIIENRTIEELALEKRAELKRRFVEYNEEGLIYFVTFHQSFSYEDFVEGIKPRTEKGKIVYEIEDGIFKHVCMEAKRHLIETAMSNLPVMEIKIDFNQLYQAFLNFLESEKFDSFKTEAGTTFMLHKISRGTSIRVRAEKSFSVYSVLKARIRKMYKHFQTGDVIENIDTAITALLGGVNTRAYWAVFKALKIFEGQYIDSLMQEEQEMAVPDDEIEAFDLNEISQLIINDSRRFVLIIDEINRGNIASIFGDLITLIESDKREGEIESLNVVLPYSKTLLSVPPNLHIIGTMNSSDRSVEAIDTALRRRFTFQEMLPKPWLIKKEGRTPIIDGVDLGNMLEAINRRIETLLDKDHCIGHSYFMKVESFDELKDIFITRIVPLLAEYFFNDFGKIGLVLGKDFVQEKRLKEEEIFADFDHEYGSELADKKIYELGAIKELNTDAFIRIYDKDYK